MLVELLTQSPAESWTLEELSSSLNVDQSTVRQAVSTWIKHSVLHENRPNHFIILEEAADLPLDADLPEPPAQCSYIPFST